MQFVLCLLLFNCFLASTDIKTILKTEAELVSYIQNIAAPEKEKGLLSSIIAKGAETNSVPIVEAWFDMLKGHRILNHLDALSEALDLAIEKESLDVLQLLLEKDRDRAFGLLPPADRIKAAKNAAKASNWTLMEALMNHVQLEGTESLIRVFDALKQEPRYRQDRFYKVAIDTHEVLLGCCKTIGK